MGEMLTHIDKLFQGCVCVSINFRAREQGVYVGGLCVYVPHLVLRDNLILSVQWFILDRKTVR